MIEIASELKNYLFTESERSRDPSLNELRAIAIDFYNGEPFGDEEEGRSRLVTRDVAEVIDYMVVSIMRTVVSGDKVVEFEPRTSSQKEMAEAATALVQWQFMREQSGYQILHDFLKAGLLEKSGVIKTWAEQTFEIVEGIASASQLDEIENVVSFEPIEGAIEVDAFGLGEQVYSYQQRVPGKVVFRDMAVPNEEFRVSPEARTLDDAAYIQHRTRHSLSWYIEQGLATKEEAATLWDDVTEDTGLSDSRDHGRSRKDNEGAQLDVSRQVWLTEEYVFWDIEGIGDTQRICVLRVGDKVLDVRPCPDQPFVLWTPFPMQHRLIGQSLADKVMDIQRTRSVLLRQAMDALYFANTPRTYIDMDRCDDNTIDDVLSVVPGAPIRGRGPNSVQNMVQPFAAGHAFEALEYMAGERESRTGITRLNQGLDADSLNKTATGTALMQAQGQQIEEYLARNFAEGVAELFEKKIRLMRDYGIVQEVRVGGDFQKIDPAMFTEDMDIGIRVGIGSGRKDQRLSHRMAILEMQKEALMQGLPIVDMDKLYNSAAGIVSDAGLGDVNNFFNDPAPQTDEQGNTIPEPERKTADVVEAEGKAALEIEKENTRQLEIQTQADKDALIAANKLEVDHARLKYEQELAIYRLNMEYGINGDLPQFEPGGSLAQ